MWRILKWWMMAISIHAPREGSDIKAIYDKGKRAISIHAPREGSDLFTSISGRGRRDFNPRSP